MRSMLKRTTLREIKGSLSRFLAILAIVALGVGFFSGLKVAKPFMIATADQYIKEQNLFDLRLLSTLGFKQEDVDAFAREKGVKAVCGSYSLDVLCTGVGESEIVIKAHSLTDGINGVELKAGRMPENEKECVVDSRLAGEEQLGKKLVLTDSNEADTLDILKDREYTIVGIVDSVYYMNFERGTTSLGNGRIAGFAYFLPEAFASEYYTEVFVKLDYRDDSQEGAVDAAETEYEIYSDAYEDYMEEMTDYWEKICKERAAIRYETILSKANQELADAEKEFYTQKADGEKELADAGKKIADAQAEIEKGEKELAVAENELEMQEQSLEEQEAQLKEQEEKLRNQETQLKGQEQLLVAQGVPLEIAEQQLAPAREQLASARRQLEAGGAGIQEGKEAIVKAREVLLEKMEEIADAKKEAEEGLREYEAARREFEEKTADGEKELTDARADIAAIEEPDSYVLDRNTNVGYVCFESDSDIVEGIADVFPVFFFMVAALVCITTMNRMVEEQRSQIGVLKALGYTEAAIMSKYSFYSGSAAFIGCVTGYLAGTWAFPQVIWKAYSIMYNLPGLLYEFHIKLGLLSVVVSLLCSIGATWFSCRFELLEPAARLMRPKSPKAGKRVFLEKLPFIWKRLEFLHKVSVRNIFRYKKRFFMMVIGISGCTALLVTGLGLKDSVTGLAEQQYEEIQIADGSISLKEGADTGEDSELMKALSDLTESFTFACEESWELVRGNKVKTVNFVILKEPEEIGSYLNLHTPKGRPLAYPKEKEAVISHKIADMYAISVGDEITVRNQDMQEITVTVSGIFENFVYNYMYIAPETYIAAMQQEPEYQTLYVNYREGQDIHQAAADARKLNGVSSVSVYLDVRERFDSMMNSMNYVVLLVIFSAGALAFIVLYNLTNINITERVREIATIKVLGFYRRETSSYVFRENIVLTAIGAGIGLLLGYFLHGFIMSRINIDMVAFDVHIRAISYIGSIALTFLFNFLVNRVMSLKLESVNMAESLKSVD